MLLLNKKRDHSQEILFPLKSHCLHKAEYSWQDSARSYSVTLCVTPSGSLIVTGCRGSAARCLLQGSLQAAPKQHCILNATSDKCLLDLPQALHVHRLREVQECFTALPLRTEAKDKQSFYKQKMQTLTCWERGKGKKTFLTGWRRRCLQRKEVKLQRVAAWKAQVEPCLGRLQHTFPQGSSICQ